MCLTIYLLLCTATWTHSDGYTFRKLIKAQPYPILTLSPPPKHLDFEEDRLNLGVPRQVLNASRMWACGGGGRGVYCITLGRARWGTFVRQESTSEVWGGE